MARARNIKPAIFKNEILGVADPLYTLLFEGLWVLADREGRLEDRPLRIKAETFPYRDGVNVDEMLNWLTDKEFIIRYEFRGNRYIQIINFKKHQSPHKNEVPSEIPGPDERDSGEIGSTSEKIGSTRADSLNPPTDSGLPPTESTPPARDGYSDDFEQAWEQYPRHAGASKKDAFKAWGARLKAGVAVDVLMAGVSRYADYCRAMETEERFIKLPETFFGPGEHYAVEWKATKPQARASPPRAPQDLDAARKAANEEAKRRLFGGDDGRTIDAQ